MEIKQAQRVTFRGRAGHGKGRKSSEQAREHLRRLLGDMPRRRDLLIEYLHRIQDHDYGLLAAMLAALADELKISQAEVFEVATFYHHFDVVREGQAGPASLTVRVCESLSCELAGSRALLERLPALLGDQVRVQPVPCVGRCDHAPVAVVDRFPVADATEAAIVAAVQSGKRECPMPDAPDLQAATTAGAYRVLAGLIAAGPEPESLFSQLEDSGLRGLGGAGFPAGRKWRIVSGFDGPRNLVVNADEGEPGTFKDRHYLETEPHRFLEGMLIAAWAVGCDACYIYLRDEYAGVRDLLEREIAALVANPPVSSADWLLPEIHLRRGAGAYICGEESGLIESIEGRRGMPRLRPPYIAEVGLFNRPTLAHNVETLLWIPTILAGGAASFAKHGRRDRKGLRSFSVSGRVCEPGVKLAPAGISVRELIDEYCGGMVDGETLYAYLPGGASGGILPASLADEPLDFDTLQKHGCFIGSAAVIILSEKDATRDAALNLMRFFQHESCGQCTPCRSGTAKAVGLMQEKNWDTDLLGELSDVMIDASICGLGQAAPNPMLSVIRFFGQEVKS
ncbi:MAG: NAD(P)H-dependent oxidoreductase subunit E [Burkholderiaceae bacterium]